jgi:hypothetical protein
VQDEEPQQDETVKNDPTREAVPRGFGIRLPAQEFPKMTLSEILNLARRLPPEQQRELARALSKPAAELPMTQFASAPAPHSVGWVKAERGHAVLATDTAPSEASIPSGPSALAGIWADHAGIAQRGLLLDSIRFEAVHEEASP